MSVNFRKWLVLFNVFFVTLVYAQEKVVTGKVTDESGFALYDASVKILEGKEVFTDLDGAFSIEANFGDTLEVSYLGLKPKSIKIGEASNYVIILGGEEVIELEGAVITALGITRDKKSLGYASQEIKGDLITQGKGSNALNALSGNVAGAVISTPSSNLGGSTRILLRGIGSITGENRPLIVIDGVPMDNSNYNSKDAQRGAGGRDYGDASFDINPDDIESYNVLKGGPASALYGSRAANGVIMITTKSGKKGKDDIVFNTGVSFDQISIFPRLQNEYGGGLTKEFKEGQEGQKGQPFQIVNIGGKDYNIVEYDADQSWGPKYNPNLMVLGWDAFDPEFPNQYMVAKPWISPKNDVKSFFRTGVTYTNSLSFSKSYENTLARLSLSDMRATGIIPNSELKRTTVSLGLNQKIRHC